MKLDRDLNPGGLGKYALLNLRKLNSASGRPGESPRWTPEVVQAIKTLEEAGALQWGRTGEEDEFFPIKLKDRYARHALEQYAAAVGSNDPEYAEAVLELSRRAGPGSPFCKTPD